MNRLTRRSSIGYLFLLGTILAGCSAPRDAAAVAKQYEGKLVRRPGDAVDDQKVYLVTNGQKHWVTSKEWILAHGYHWPSDVSTIDADDLALIPDGPALR
jgi:hypothetical protein